MSAVAATKIVASLVVSTGVGTIVASACKASAVHIVNRSPRTIIRMANKVSVIVGAAVLSSMVADQAVKYTEDKIDEAVENTEEIVKNVKAGLNARKQVLAQDEAEKKTVVQPDMSDHDIPTGDEVISGTITKTPKARKR